MSWWPLGKAMADFVSEKPLEFVPAIGMDGFLLGARRKDESTHDHAFLVVGKGIIRCSACGLTCKLYDVNDAV